MTRAYLLEKYGPRLTLDDLAEVLKLSKKSLYNMVNACTAQCLQGIHGFVYPICITRNNDDTNELYGRRHAQD